MISEWRLPGDDRVWLTYSANYLFRAGGVRWALDPLTLHQRLPLAAQVDIADSLSTISFVLLSHRHADHLDLNLIRELGQFPIRWVIPESLRSLVINQCGLQESTVITPEMLTPLHIENVSIVAFEGMHWEPLPSGSNHQHRGVPSVGYLIEFNAKRWMFPGDIRCYDVLNLPIRSPLDRVFAHLWLGRGSALLDDPPQLDAFCEFFAQMPVSRIVITHMEEVGRQAEDYWDARHYTLVAHRLKQLAPGVSISSAYLGESVPL
jgi:hypothetical protein